VIKETSRFPQKQIASRGVIVAFRRPAMVNRHTEATAIELVMGCSLVIAALVITALIVRLLTTAVPLFERMVIPSALAQGAPKTLVALFAHADDEGAAAPVLARYAREGVEVYVIIATDGAQGGAHTSVPRGAALARVRSEEARCATDALGIHPPILLGFPDAQLGSYMEDHARLPQLTARIQEALQALRPDAVITWGPDGATGHPDHRIVGSIATQLVRAGAPGAPERLFYVTLPQEAIAAMNPGRGNMYLMPAPKYFTARISFSSSDFEAARRSMACHKTQYSDDVVQRISASTRDALKGELALMPWLPAAATTDLFR
jgi:LmbE family N-acetylglucosaminyl deacetylase